MIHEWEFTRLKFEFKVCLVISVVLLRVQNLPSVCQTARILLPGLQLQVYTLHFYLNYRQIERFFVVAAFLKHLALCINVLPT